MKAAANGTQSLVQIGNRKTNKGNAEERTARKARWQNIRPLVAQIYIENRCNLKCEHCYESDETHPGHRYALSLEDYERIFDELKDLGVLSITFTGGEIFLRRDALDIVALARKKRFEVALFTSGTLLDEKKAERIAELKVKTVEVSLYSHEPDVHDSFTRVPGSHARSINALRLLHEHGVPTVLKANLMTFNVDYIDDLVQLATSLGADYQFDPTVKPRMDGDRTPLKYALTPEQIRRLVLNRPELYMAFQKFVPGELCNGSRSLIAEQDVLCGAARSFISLSADGGVYACGFFPSAGGHIKEQSLHDIWFGSAQFSRIRETTYGRMTACTDCDVKSTCSPCMAYAEVEHGDHTQCATSSRQLAEAVRGLADRKVRADQKLRQGKSLPIVGSLQVPRRALKSGVAGLSTE